MLRTLVILGCLLHGLCLRGQLPLWQWAADASSPGDEQAWDVCMAPSGSSVYVAGSYDANLGLIFGLPFLTAAKDGFVSRYTTGGAFVNAFRIGGSGDDEVKGVTCDAAGNVYIAGYFSGTADFDPGLFSTYTLTASGGHDIFLAKYSAGGSLLWAVNAGSSGDDEALRVHAAADGIYLTGRTGGGATFYGTTAATLAASALQGGDNFFGARYSFAGIPQWVISGGSAGDDAGQCVTADSNQVYFSGQFAGSFTMYSPTGASTFTLSAPTTTASDALVISCDHNGALLWVTPFASAGADAAAGLALDAARLYVGGSFSGSVLNVPASAPQLTLAGQGGADHALIGLSRSTGAPQWIGAETGSGSGDERCYDLAIDASGQLVMSGAFTSSLNFAPFGGSLLSSSGSTDMFVAAFTTDGDFLWAQRGGGTNTEAAYGICAPPAGGIVAAGEYGTGGLFGTFLLASGAGKNVFVAQTGCDAVTGNTVAGTQSVCTGSAPVGISGSAPLGSAAYQWQSNDGSGWTSAPGTNTLQAYAPVSLTVSTQFRRLLLYNGCRYASNAASVTVVQPPSPAVVGASFAVCGTTANLQAQAPSTGTGAWAVLSGSAAVSSSVGATATASALYPGLNVFAWTTVNAPCPASTATLVIRSDQPPSPAIAGASQTICASTVTLVATPPVIGAGTWLAFSAGALVSASTAATSGASLAAGANAFIWTVTNGVCSPERDTVVVYRDLPPTVSVAGNSMEICSPGTTLNANAPTVGSGTWVAPPGATIAAVNSPSSAVSGLVPGVNTITWVIGNGVCPVSSSTVDIVRDLPPSPALVMPSFTVCSSSASLVATSPSTGTGSWSVVSGGAALTVTGGISTVADSLSIGANVFGWTVESGVCPSSSATLSVTRDAPPSAAAACADMSVCSSAATLSAAVPLTGSGQWLVSTGSAAVVAPAQPTTAVSSLSPGVNKFIWRTSNGSCPFSDDTVTVIRDVPPGFANAGISQTLCQQTATLSAGSPSAGAGAWSVVSGSAIIGSTASAMTQVTLLTGGAHLFRWTLSNGSCAASSDSVYIERDLPPSIASASADFSVCGTSATLAAASPSMGTGAWTPSLAVSSISSATTTVTGLAPGTNTFVWTVSNGVCPPSSDSVFISSFLPPGPAVAGVDQTVCASGVTLSAGQATAGTGTWQAPSSVSLSSVSSMTPIVTNLAAGANTFTWTVSNGSCPPAAATVVVSRDLPPSPAVVASGQTVCAMSSTLSAQQPGTGTGLWSVLTGPATVSAVSSATTTAAGLGGGANAFAWTVSNGVCPPSAATLTIQRDVDPSPAVTGGSFAVCDGTATVWANSPAVGSGSWMPPGGGSVISPLSSTTGVSGLAAGVNKFVWSVSNGVCPVNSDTAIVKRDLPPGTAFAGGSQTLCAASATLAAFQPSAGAGTWSSVLTGDSLMAPQSATTGVQLTATAVHGFVWTVANGVCAASSDTTWIMRDAFPGPAIAGPDLQVCGGSATLAAATPSAGQGTWMVLSGTAGMGFPGGATTTATGLGAGQSLFLWKITNGVCPPVEDTVAVFSFAPPSEAAAGEDIEVCADSCRLKATVPAIGAVNWRALNDGIALGDSTQASTSVKLTVGSHTLVLAVSNGVCPSSFDTLVVVRDAPPSAANSSVPAAVCGSSLSLSAVSPQTGTGMWKAISGGATIDDPVAAETVASHLPEGESRFVWTVSNGVCLASSDTAIVECSIPASVVDAGKDIIVCTPSVQLHASTADHGSGRWKSALQLNDSLRPDAVALALSEGRNYFVWEIVNGFCPLQRDTVRVDRLDSISNVNAGSSFESEQLEARMSATLPEGASGSWSVIGGGGSVLSAGDPSTAVALQPGTNSFRWTVKWGSCPEASADITVYVRPFGVPNAFSPNGDGLNDRLELTSEALEAPVKLRILDRLGQIVFESDDYRNDWDGLYRGAPLPDDTYYYTLSTSRIRSMSGFIIMKRTP